MKFTIGTIVSDWSEYGSMFKSFLNAGFDQDSCQYIAVNNADGNKYDMFSGGNHILSQATGDYVILAHQDVRAVFDNRQQLEERLAELDSADPNWAVAANAGSTPDSRWVLRITDKYGTDWSQGDFPEKVDMVDGNLIIIKRSALISFSGNISGYHYYGWDICLNADIKGMSSYVIDWHLIHLGDGEVGDDFFACKKMFTDKWNRALRNRSIGSFDHDAVSLSGMTDYGN